MVVALNEDLIRENTFKKDHNLDLIEKDVVVEEDIDIEVEDLKEKYIQQDKTIEEIGNPLEFINMKEDVDFVSVTPEDMKDRKFQGNFSF